MAGGIVSRTAHFALHRLLLADTPPAGPGSSEPQALFSLGGVWLGAMVPKRWARRAVTRNAIKRQIYTVGLAYEYRLALTAPDAAHVVRLRAGFDRKQFVSAMSEPLRLAVRTELQQLFAHATRRAAGGERVAAGQLPAVAAPAKVSASC